MRIPVVASNKSYTPRVRSGAWAMLISLLKIDKKTGRPQATKEELIAEVRALSDEKVPFIFRRQVMQR